MGGVFFLTHREEDVGSTLPIGYVLRHLNNRKGKLLTFLHVFGNQGGDLAYTLSSFGVSSVVSRPKR